MSVFSFKNFSSQLLRQRMSENFRFALPIVAGQIGQMMFGIADIFVAGKYSATALAATGLASGFSSPLFMLSFGILNSIAPTVAYDRGELRKDSTQGHHRFFWPSLTMALIVSLLMWPATLVILQFYDQMGLNPELKNSVHDYMIWVTPSIIFACLFQATKEYLQAHLNTFFANGLILFFNILNLIFNFVFMFGHGPIPPMGIKGLAIATLTTRFLLFLCLFIYALHFLKSQSPKFSLRPNLEQLFHLPLLKQLFKLGIPIGLGVLTEVLVFCTVTLLIGRMPTVYSAAHNVVLTLASLTFMLPLALSSASAVKVAHSFGQKNIMDVAYNSASCTLLAVICMMATASIYIFFPQALVSFITNDEGVTQASAILLFWVALFQIPDGIQITLWGALRGLSVTKAPLFICLVCHWLIGLPLGAYLAFKQEKMAEGLWIGLTCGLITLATGLLILWYRKIKSLSLNKALIPS